jgi:uncharacterized membrane protein YqjE
MSVTDSNTSSYGLQGIFHPLKRVLSTLSSALHTRLELAVTEIEEERERLKQTLLLTLFFFFGFSLGIILLTIFVVALFWDGGWVYALGCLAFIYLGIGLAAALILRTKVSQRPRLLSATLAELAKDRDRLRASYRE